MHTRATASHAQEEGGGAEEQGDEEEEAEERKGQAEADEDNVHEAVHNLRSGVSLDSTSIAYCSHAPAASLVQP